MILITKNKFKAILLGPLLLGAVFAMVTGWAAWSHNPQEEFRVGYVPKLDFFLLVGFNFLTVTVVLSLLLAVIFYLFSRSSKI